MDNIAEEECSTNHPTWDQAGSSGEEASSSVANNIHIMCEKLSHKRPSIYKVPEHLRKLNENAYTTWHVSIGPYHHKSQKYRVMEEYKLVYMKSLILRGRGRGRGRGRRGATINNPPNTNFEELTKHEIN